MNGPGFTRQTTTPSLPLTHRHPAARPIPGPRLARAGIFHGPLQLLLEEPGWNVLRPATDFVLLCVAVVIGARRRSGRATPIGGCARRCWRCRR